MAATVSPRNTSSETSRPLAFGSAAVGDVTVFLHPVELACKIVADDLDPRQSEGVEARRARTPGWTAGHLENRVEAIAHHLAGLRVPPAAGVGQLAVLGPDAERKREGPHPLSRHRRVDRHQTPRD